MAEITKGEGFVEARMEREFAHSVSRVWRALTAADELPLWLAAGSIEPRVGGRAQLDFGDSGVVIDSVVRAYEPERSLDYDWSSPGQPSRPMRWRIETTPNGALVTLTLRVPAEEDAGRSFAGWDAHLDMLAAMLEGVPIKFPFETFKAARDRYRALLA